MIENFIQTISGIADTISMIVQYFIHAIKSVFFLLESLVKAVIFVFESLVFLPAWFGVIVAVVVSILIVKLLVPGGD